MSISNASLELDEEIGIWVKSNGRTHEGSADSKGADRADALDEAASAKFRKTSRPRSRNPTPEMRWRGRSVHNRGFAARSALVTHYFVDLNPIAISLGPLQVRWYGIMYVIGIGIDRKSVV